MHLTLDDLAALACPICRGLLRSDAELEGQHEISNGYLDCTQCGRAWLVNNGIAELLETCTLHGSDAWLRPIYDIVAPWHDLGVTLALPWMQFPDFGASRDRYMQRIDLASLEQHDDGPVRVLEVGVGSGGNLPLIQRDLPADLDVELWGLDYSRVMLFECKRRLPWYTTRPVRLVLGDAHKLPFGDATFDRVFHVGGINGYENPRAALAEMARVARQDTPIVVVDEHLDPNRVHFPHHYLWYRALTWFNTLSGPPVDELPPGAAHVDVRPVSRFYYCLTFRMPAGARRDAGAGDGDGLRARAPATAETAETPETGSSEGGTTMDLTPAELATIRGAYSETVMNGVLKAGFNTYAETADWLNALTDAFGTNLPPEGTQPRQRLCAVDRERCLVALLCSRGGKGTLGIHIYMAICNGVEQEEIKHILFLTGVYSGVENFARGLSVLEGTVVAIKAQIIRTPVDPAAMTTAILAALGL